MNVNPSIFRAYDIRGKYPEDLNAHLAAAVARAYLGQYPHVQKLALAFDPQASSPELAKAIKDTLLSAGKEVFELGLAPDPLFYFSLFHYGLDGGFMVSSSHVVEFSGLTMSVRKPGSKVVADVVEEELQQISRGVLAGAPKLPARKEKGKASSLDATEEYVSYVAQRISLKRPLKVVFDCGNGAMGFLAEKVFSRLGCEVQTLYGEPNGKYPNHAPDPYLEENLKDLQKTILQEQADLGFAFDADGDRVGVVDNEGSIVSGDACLLLLAEHVTERHQGSVVHDMRVSKAFLDEMKKKGVATHFSVSHHSAILKKILETKSVFGGEVTLHFLFPADYYPCDDALFAALKLAEVASLHSPFHSFVGQLPSYPASPEVFVATPDKEKFQIIRQLQENLRKAGYDFIDIDGARITFEKGWALARAANTSPFIKIRFEGETEKDLREIEKEALALFQQAGIPLSKDHYRELGLTF